MSEKLSRFHRRTRLLLVENSLHTTGAFTSAMSIANALKAEYEIEFVLPKASVQKPSVEAAGFVCHSLPMSEIGRSWQRLLKYLPVLIINTIRLRNLLRDRQIDVLVINDYYNLLGFMAKITGWSGTLLTYVRLMPFSQQRVLNKVWTTLALCCSAKVLAVSRAVVMQLPNRDTVQLLYDPKCFVERYPCVPGGCNENEIRCLYLSNYIHGKGHQCALNSFAQVYRQNPSLRLRFVGGDMGLEKNRVLKQSLREKAVLLGLAEVVSVHGFSDDVEREIKDSDIILNFSESESFSHTCLEACAFGRPVIATRCGGPEEIIDDGVSGLLVPVSDVKAMAEAIIRLSLNESLRQFMGGAGRRIVRGRFSGEVYLSAFKELQL